MFSADDFVNASVQVSSYTVALGGEGRRSATTREMFTQAAEQQRRLASIEKAVLDEAGCVWTCTAAHELKTLVSRLHHACAHPDFDYGITETPRKSGVQPSFPDDGGNWATNTEQGQNGWARFDIAEEWYWRRPKALRPTPPVKDCRNCVHRRTEQIGALAGKVVSRSSRCARDRSPFFLHRWLDEAKANLEGTCAFFTGRIGAMRQDEDLEMFCPKCGCRGGSAGDGEMYCACGARWRPVMP